MSVRVARRAHCRCEVVRNYDYDEAADKLRCKVRFLQDNIRNFPHQKLGESVAFCDCELAIIQALRSVMPAAVEQLLTAEAAEPAPAETPVIPLHALKPSGAKKRARA